MPSSFDEAASKNLCFGCGDHWKKEHKCKKSSKLNHVRKYLKRGHSAVHLVSEFITDLEKSDSDHESDKDEHPKNTHHTTSETVAKFGSFHPDTLHNVVQDVDEEIATLDVSSALKPYTDPINMHNGDIYFPGSDMD